MSPRDIAYRAVRNRGTIGGSLCHADPAADWVSVLMLLIRRLRLIEGPAGRREVAVESFITAPSSTALARQRASWRPCAFRSSPRQARWGHYKFCRKPGEFAEAIGAVLLDPDRGVCRAVIGATRGAPHVIADAAAVAGQLRRGTRATQPSMPRASATIPMSVSIHHVALQRAWRAARSGLVCL